MEKFIHKLFKKPFQRSAQAALRNGEKDELREEMHAFMDTHPLPVRTSLFEALRGKTPGYPFRFMLPHVAAFVLLFTGGCTVFIAESAGPTEPLYAFKRAVNENVLMGISAFSPEFRAEVDSQLLSRRLLDAETLLAGNNTNEIQSNAIRTDIENHTDALYTYIQKENSSGDITSAYRVGNSVETILDAHNSVLYFMAAADTSKDATETNELIVALEGKRSDLEKIQEDVDAALAKQREKLREEIAAETGLLEEELEDIHEMLKALREDQTAIEGERPEREIASLIENSKKVSTHVKETDDPLTRIEALQQAVSDGEKAHIIISAYKELQEELSSGD